MTPEKQDLPALKENNYETFPSLEKKKEKDEFTVADAIEHIGVGKFQVLIACGSGFAWIADGMEIMVISLLGPTLICNWGISVTEEAALTTVVFVGLLFGSPFFGYFADTYGRRKLGTVATRQVFKSSLDQEIAITCIQSLLFSSICVTFYGILSAFSPLVGWLFFLRCMVGFSIGGGIQAVTYFSEFLPNKVRGRGVMCVEIFWALGAALEVVLGLLILEPYGWEWWLIASAFPSLIYVFCCMWMPNSPYFCMADGDLEGAMKTLRLAAKLNNTTLPEGTLVRDPQIPRGRPTDLLIPKFRTTTILLSFLWFSAAFCYYGVILFTTEMIVMGTTCAPSDFDDIVSVNSTSDSSCVPLTDDDYYFLLWTSFAELPGLFLGALLIDPLGRRRTLSLLYFAFTLTAGLLFICMDTTPMVFILFACRAVIASAFQVLYVYTPEVYPTETRAIAVGLGSAAARLGALITPFVAQVLLDLSLWYALAVYGLIGIVSCLLALTLPIETKGRTLRDDACYR